MSQPQPTSDQTKPDDELVIDSLETLKVIADPMRKRIMELFDKPQTVKQVAKQLNTTASKLYYHVNLLEEHGLVRVTDTRIVSGIIEKHYQMSARTLKVKAGLLSPNTTDGDESLNAILSDMMDYTKEEIRASVRAGVIDLNEGAAQAQSLLMSYLNTPLTAAQATVFYERLKALVAEIDQVAAANEDSPDVPNYILHVVMFPTANPPASEDSAEDE